MIRRVPIEIPDGNLLAEEVTQHSAQRPLITRRLAIVSLLGVTSVGITAGLLYVKTLPHHSTSHSSPPTITPLLFYQTFPPVYVNYTDWSPSGELLACALGSDLVQIIEATTGKALLTYRGHTSFVNCVMWSPDGKLIASASADKTVQIWKPEQF